MKQHEAVIQTLENLGGSATLAQLYHEVMTITDCKWGTKTPFASIRRIVQTRLEIFKVRPGLWALETHRKALGLEKPDDLSKEKRDEVHTYYQGVLISLGNMKGFQTYSPQQDKNKTYAGKPLRVIRTLGEIPFFSHEMLVKRAETIDVVWFNQRLMPNAFFEIEHSTDIQNSLGKFCDLQDFYTRMFIVADGHRRGEFEQKLRYVSFEDVANRVKFLDYESIVKQYETEVIRASQEQLL